MAEQKVLLQWDADGERRYETGNKKGVLYPRIKGVYQAGVSWNGLTAVTESPSGAEASEMWADDTKYGEIRSSEQFGGTIEAYQSPKEFDQCDGSYSPVNGMSIGQQSRKPFGFSYVTTIGNDEEGLDYGYTLHLVYNAMAKPSTRSHKTVNNSPEGETLSWEFTTTPTVINAVDAEGKQLKPTAHLYFDSTEVDSVKLKALEKILYGTPAEDSKEAIPPRLPSPDEVIAMFAAEG